MNIQKSDMPAVEVATRYFELSESILQAMINATLKNNLPVVFVLNRPLFHACYKGLWMCLVEGSKDLPDDLLKLGRDIDAVIEQKFEAWRAPFVNKGTRSRFSTFLKSPIHKELAAQGKVRPSTLIERLHNDVHGGLPALDYYQQLVQAGSLLHSAKELCIIGHDPLYLTLRFAMSMRFPEGPVRRDGLMAEPFGNQILKIYDLAE